MLTAVVLAIFGLLFIWFTLWALDNDWKEWIIQTAILLGIVLVTGLVIGLLGLYSLILVFFLIAVFILFKDHFRGMF